jgi:glycosyltransferase involved in cell wall biosynthesis
MDLMAEMLVRHWPGGGVAGGDADGPNGAAPITAEAVRPAMVRRFGRLPSFGATRTALNADRLLNRHFDYPDRLRSLREGFDLFHVADHSYAHLVHVLPRRRTGVFCHDLDAFRCLLDPAAEPRPAWFRAMASRILRGLQKAEVVFLLTREIGRQVVERGLLDPARLVVAHPGVAAEYTPEPPAPSASASASGSADGTAQTPALPPALSDSPFLLHVGSCIPRKRIDVLLEVFAEVRRRHPGLWLVQIGGEFTFSHRELISRRGLSGSVVQARGLSRSAIAALYRRAAVVLQPSEAEGFGLPVAEAMACGAAVVASDLPVLREVGGPAAVYRPVGDVAAWSDAVAGLLSDPASAPPRAGRLAQASLFRWDRHAAIVAEAYAKLIAD